MGKVLRPENTARRSSETPLKPSLQKRLENLDSMPRKTPRLFLLEKVEWGLRCGLSGNPASAMVTSEKIGKGKPPVAVTGWKIFGKTCWT
jgi:Mrp family chromosome partitioning ATPase